MQENTNIKDRRQVTNYQTNVYMHCVVIESQKSNILETPLAIASETRQP